MVPKIYVQFHCDMINFTNFKHDAQIKASLDISMSKLTLSNLSINLSDLNFLHVNLLFVVLKLSQCFVEFSSFSTCKFQYIG